MGPFPPKGAEGALESPLGPLGSPWVPCVLRISNRHALFSPAVISVECLYSVDLANALQVSAIARMFYSLTRLAFSRSMFAFYRMSADAVGF